MDDLGLLKNRQGVQELGGKDADEARTETSERVLLDELVEVVGEEFEDEAEVRVVDEGVFEAEHVVFVVLVPLVVDLRAGGSGLSAERGTKARRTSSRIVTSIMLCWKYAGLFLTTLTATISCVLRFWHLTTWPNVPCPSTSRIKYLQPRISSLLAAPPLAARTDPSPPVLGRRSRREYSRYQIGRAHV